ncbi:MAG: EamA family transporter [Clostridia bacterium]|nr:EamA family transporter [Clostridia bacterium]
MDILLILVIIFMYSFQSLFQTFFAKAFTGRSDLETPVFCILQSIAIVFITLCFIGFDFKVSWPTVLLGTVNALLLFGYNTAFLKASTKGSYAFMNVMMIGGDILVPMVYVAFLGILPTWYQFIAIGTMLISFLLMNIEDMKLKGTKGIYYIMCILLFLFNGLYGTMLKVQEQVKVEENKEMIIITFALMGVIATVQLAFKEKKNFFKSFKLGKKCILWLCLCLLAAALAINGMVMVVARVENTAVLYSLLNGGVLVVSAIYSLILFKEKPSPIKLLGILLAAGSMVVLGLPT